MDERGYEKFWAEKPLYRSWGDGYKEWQISLAHVLRIAFAQARQELFMAEWEVHTCSNFLLDCLHVFWNLDQNSFRFSIAFHSAKRTQVGKIVAIKYVILIKTS